MRILQVIPDLTLGSGGPQTAVRRLSRALASRGHDVTIATTDGEWGGGHLPVVPNVPYRESGYTVYYFSAQWPRRYVVSWPFLRFMAKSAADFDVIHVHSVFLFTTLVACAYARRARTPYIVRPHGTFDPFLMRRKRLLKSAYLRLIEKKNLDAAYAIHYTTEEEACLASTLDIRSRPIVIPLGVDPDEFTPDDAIDSSRSEIPELNRARRVLFYGRVNFKKGLDLLIPAFSELSKGFDNVHLFIVGPDNDNYGVQIRRWIAERNLDERVTILPAVSGGDRTRILQSADVFVLPSYTENFGLAVIEAMSAGKPVVISNKVNIHREVTAAGAGIVTGLEVSEIAAALAEVLGNPEEARRMGQRGRHLVNSRYRWESVAEQLEGLYSRACGHD